MYGRKPNVGASTSTRHNQPGTKEKKMVRSLLILAIIAGLGIAACGKKGPPHLPQETEDQAA